MNSKRGTELEVGDILAGSNAAGGYPITHFGPWSGRFTTATGRVAFSGDWSITVFDDDHWWQCPEHKTWEPSPVCLKCWQQEEASDETP